ncbi:hypothetical protein F5J12DRAFT_852072 [Pisolithus orientalis]|uniref:uncharacterized protein n=1 Tax=Pisolithus orientalis TaxID=936130 RepID=UPI002224339D|nr:uncharacterized protein F5J12DRAFT_852072 [Pisolithus orientalis]KAI5997284.1 hypothetical protein F5J12DRAFT_852072 [Pisolithus orientalis]
MRMDTYYLCIQMSLDIATSLYAVQFSFLYYDYALTFSREIDLFWKRPRRSWPFVLFIANRYLTVLGRVPMSIYLFWSTNDTNYGVRVCPRLWFIVA